LTIVQRSIHYKKNLFSKECHISALGLEEAAEPVTYTPEEEVRNKGRR